MHENSTAVRILLIINELLDFRFSHSVTMLRVSNLLNSKLINNLLRFATIIMHNGLRNHCLISMLYYTGMRISEALNIKLSDIEQVNNDLYIIKIIGKGNISITSKIYYHNELSMNELNLLKAV